MLAVANLTVVLPADQASPDDGYAQAVLLNDAICLGSLCPPNATQSGSFSVDQNLDVQTDLGYVIELYATAGGTDGSASASVDPSLALAINDPAYTLEFSPGLVPALATPEPSGLVLLGSGMFGVAAIFVRRRSSAISCR
jgi:hypothetical protein